MSKNEIISVQDKLRDLYAAERTLQKNTQELLRTSHKELINELQIALKEALQHQDDHEQGLRLNCLATLLPKVQGPAAIDMMIDMLASENEDARDHVGFSIIETAHDRLGEVQKGIERALTRLPAGSPALATLPYVMLGLADLDVCPMMRPFLSHKDARAVASAIDVCVELEDERALPWLEEIAKDSRQVELQDDNGEEGYITIGELAQDAIRELESLGSELDDHND